MKKILRSTLKNIVFAFGILYGINIFLSNTSIYIPINVWTLIITTILGVPGLISIFAIFFLIK